MEIESRAPKKIAEPYWNDQKDFREILNDHFLKKVRVNKSYSLRSFAHFLGVHPATLSHLMSGKRKVTLKTIKMIGTRLGMGVDELTRIFKNGQIRGAFNSSESEASLGANFNLLNSATAESLSEWYYDAILELVNTKGFKSDPQWISHRLGLSIIEVRQALDRLISFGLLKFDGKGSLYSVNDNNTTQITENHSSGALREYQKVLGLKSLEALELVPVETRTHSSMMIAINAKDLDLYRDLIKKFRRELNHLSSDRIEDSNQVYAFQISGFPLTSLPVEK